jgi:alpha-beta hydrolase superfamily lysophospholipase
MMKSVRSLYVILGFLTVSTASAAPVLSTRYLSLERGALEVRIGEQRPVDGKIVGDVLFLHGLGDRLDNHAPLFEAWNSAGLRVIALDLPSHGETRGAGNNLNLYSFTDLGRIVAAVERATREDARRPLVLAGWSTGALLALRVVQSPAFEPLGRPVAGLVLLAPGVAVRTLVGEAGVITERSLTRNPAPPHRGPISPRSPLLVPLFAKKLVVNAALARHEAVPRAVPALTIVGGDDEDAYVKSREIKEWVAEQRKAGHRAMPAFQCDGAFHELDNEPEPVGGTVRAAAALFARVFAAGGQALGQVPAGICRPI